MSLGSNTNLQLGQRYTFTYVPGGLDFSLGSPVANWQAKASAIDYISDVVVASGSALAGIGGFFGSSSVTVSFTYQGTGDTVDSTASDIASAMAGIFSSFTLQDAEAGNNSTSSIPGVVKNPGSPSCLSLQNPNCLVIAIIVGIVAIFFLIQFVEGAGQGAGRRASESIA